MNKTLIEWVKNPDNKTQGYTWNPITGCLNDCPYCYAKKLANGRLKSRYLANHNIAPCESPEEAFKARWQYPFYPRFWEDRLFQPMNDRRISEKGIFVCDMSDLFGIGIPEQWTKAVMDVIEDCPIDRFYLLTKQPQNLIKFEFPDNCWVGVTATDQEKMYWAVSKLEKIQAKVKYLSFEPLLGWKSPKDWLVSSLPDYLLCAGIRWVIIGAQTKPYKPPKIEWVEEIIQACDKTSIPVFLKDNLKPLLGRDYSKGIEGYAPQWAYTNHKLRQEMPNA